MAAVAPKEALADDRAGFSILTEKHSVDTNARFTIILGAMTIPSKVRYLDSPYRVAGLMASQGVLRLIWLTVPLESCHV